MASIPIPEIAITVQDRGSVVPRALVQHETADIAILITPEHSAVKALKDQGPVGSIGLGFDFFAYGYPADVFYDGNEPPPNPPPRLFKGYFQRIFEYRGKDFRYRAGEMNIPCPQGLSGGPVIASGSGQPVGVATANMRSAIASEMIEEIHTEGRVEKSFYQEVVNYGVCLLLDPLRDWLDRNIRDTTTVQDSDNLSDNRER